MSRKKGIFTKPELRNLLTKKNSCVALKSSVIDVYLLPYYLNDVVTGLWNALHSKLKAYDSKLEGILLGYENIKVDLDAGRFSGRNAEIKYPVSCDCYVFQPSVGDKLQGKVNQMSSDHIGCIVHQYFNATIKRPTDEPHEDWNNRCIDYDQVITFRVKDLDYTGYIPYIEGELETYMAETSKKRNHNFPETKYRSDASLISSTQLPSERSSNSSFSDSGLEFDVLSPIPQLKNSGKQSKSFKNDHVEERCLQNKSPDVNNTQLKRKHEISPESRSAKKVKMTSDSDAGSSTRESDFIKKKKKKSIFDFLAFENNSSTKGMTDSKIKKSPKNSDAKIVLKNNQEQEINLSPYSDAIESVIKQTTSTSYPNILDSVLQLNKNAEENEHQNVIKKKKKRLEDLAQVSDSDLGSLIKKKKQKSPVKPMPSISENSSSSVLIVSKNKNQSVSENETPKAVKKTKQMKITEMSSPITKKNIINKETIIEANIKKHKQAKITEVYAAKGREYKEKISDTKETKIKSNNKLVSKDKNERLSLSPYSDAIESVINKASSNSYSDTIDSVIKQSKIAEKSGINKNKNKFEERDITLEPGSNEHSNIVEKKKKKSPNKPMQNQNNSFLQSKGYNDTVGNEEERKFRKSNDKLVSYNENDALSLSPYSDAIESVIKQSKIAEKEKRSAIKKSKHEERVILSESGTIGYSSLVDKKKKKSPTKSMPTITQNNSVMQSIGNKDTVGNAKESKIRKSNDKLVLKDENETLPLTPYSDAIESVIKKTTTTSYSNTIKSSSKKSSSVEEKLEKQSPSAIKKKNKKIYNTESNTISEKKSSSNTDLHISEAIESVIEKVKSDSEEHGTLNKKKKKSPVKQLSSLNEDDNRSVVLTKKKKDKMEIIDSPKSEKINKRPIEKKNNEIDSSMKQKSIVSFLTADSSKGNKIRKSNVKPISKNENEELPLSPYSDAIESVIKQTNSVSYMDAIDSVIKQSAYE